MQESVPHQSDDVANMSPSRCRSSNSMGRRRHNNDAAAAPKISRIDAILLLLTFVLTITGAVLVVLHETKSLSSPTAFSLEAENIDSNEQYDTYNVTYLETLSIGETMKSFGSSSFHAIPAQLDSEWLMPNRTANAKHRFQPSEPMPHAATPQAQIHPNSDQMDRPATTVPNKLREINGISVILNDESKSAHEPVIATNQAHGDSMDQMQRFYFSFGSYFLFGFDLKDWFDCSHWASWLGLCSKNATVPELRQPGDEGA
jgi:hypothetical protein